jgi:hypothetical protein
MPFTCQISEANRIVLGEAPSRFFPALMKLLLAFLSALISVHPLSAAKLELHHSKAELRGPAEREQAKDCIGAWEDEKTTVVWSIRVDQPGEVEIECLQAAEARSAGNGYDVVIGEAKASGRVTATPE